MLTITRIGRYQRGLLHVAGDFQRVLAPGTHWVWGFDRSVQVVSLSDELEVSCRPLEAYLANPEFLDEVLVADLSDAERALVWVDGRVHGLLGPGKTAFWKGLSGNVTKGLENAAKAKDKVKDVKFPFFGKSTDEAEAAADDKKLEDNEGNPYKEQEVPKDAVDAHAETMDNDEPDALLEEDFSPSNVQKDSEPQVEVIDEAEPQ